LLQRESAPGLRRKDVAAKEAGWCGRGQVAAEAKITAQEQHQEARYVYNTDD
jgi:hypothetical protein